MNISAFICRDVSFGVVCQIVKFVKWIQGCWTWNLLFLIVILAEYRILILRANDLHKSQNPIDCFFVCGLKALCRCWLVWRLCADFHFTLETQGGSNEKCESNQQCGKLPMAILWTNTAQESWWKINIGCTSSSSRWQCVAILNCTLHWEADDVVCKELFLWPLYSRSKWTAEVFMVEFSHPTLKRRERQYGWGGRRVPSAGRKAAAAGLSCSPASNFVAAHTVRSLSIVHRFRTHSTGPFWETNDWTGPFFENQFDWSFFSKPIQLVPFWESIRIGLLGKSMIQLINWSLYREPIQLVLFWEPIQLVPFSEPIWLVLFLNPFIQLWRPKTPRRSLSTDYENVCLISVMLWFLSPESFGWRSPPSASWGSCSTTPPTSSSTASVKTSNLPKMFLALSTTTEWKGKMWWWWARRLTKTEMNAWNLLLGTNLGNKYICNIHDVGHRLKIREAIL